MNSDSVDLRATVGRVLGVLGVLCAVVGIFVLNGISIEFPGIMLGGLGYYISLTLLIRRVREASRATIEGGGRVA